MDPFDPVTFERMTAGQARELAERASAPQRICEDHFYSRLKLMIRQQASQGSYTCTYAIPGFELGLPLYNARDVAASLQERFSKEGWKVARSGTILRIGWRSASRPFLKSLHR